MQVLQLIFFTKIYIAAIVLIVVHCSNHEMQAENENK